MLTRRRVIAAKVEGVEGTAEAITVAEAGILAIDPKFDIDFKSYDRNNIKLNTLSNLVPLMGQRSVKISFKAEVKGAGAAYSAILKPALGTYLKGCGFAETIDVTAGAEKATYLPASTGIPSLTIWVYEDGLIKKARGCRGTVKFTGKVGEPVFAEFSFDGVFDAVVDGAMIAPTFEATVPAVLMGTTLSLDAVTTMVAESFGIDIANSLQLRGSMSAPDGYLSALLTDRKPTFSLDPEMALVATYDFIGKWKAAASAALSIGPVGPAGVYNKFTLSAPKCVYTKVGSGDRAGIQTADIAGNLAMNTGDDEVKLEFVK